ncbi:hypothetical protein ACGF0D_20380 [Kitasatospora sp. NPDC048298]
MGLPRQVVALDPAALTSQTPSRRTGTSSQVLLDRVVGVLPRGIPGTNA